MTFYQELSEKDYVRRRYGTFSETRLARVHARFRAAVAIWKRDHLEEFGDSDTILAVATLIEHAYESTRAYLINALFEGFLAGAIIFAVCLIFQRPIQESFLLGIFIWVLVGFLESIRQEQIAKDFLRNRLRHLMTFGDEDLILKFLQESSFRIYDVFTNGTAFLGFGALREKE
jgi:hypothetical protein